MWEGLKPGPPCPLRVNGDEFGIGCAYLRPEQGIVAPPFRGVDVDRHDVEVADKGNRHLLFEQLRSISVQPLEPPQFVIELRPGCWIAVRKIEASDHDTVEAFVLLRDGMKKAKVASVARTVLFRRMRTVLIRPHGKGLIAATLNFDYEVRSSTEAFEKLPDLKIEGEMLELAEHIIGTKKGSFDASTFDDRYEAAVAELVKAKIDGRALPKKKAPTASKPSDLLQALLRESAGVGAKTASKPAAANANKGAARQKATRLAAAAKAKLAAAPTRRAG